MKVYLDLIFILNFGFDFLLLLVVGIILRRTATIKRLLLGALTGGLSIFTLFMHITSLELFFIKIIISILMVIISFKYKNIQYTGYNIFFLYTASLLLGGFLYFLNVQFSYKQDGLIFYHNGLSVNWILLLIISPIILYVYVKQAINLKNNYSNYYQIDIYFKDGSQKQLSAFLDTGNQLIDPYKKRPIILINKKEVINKCNDEDIVLVPYETLNTHGLLKCIIPEKVFIVGIGMRKNVLLGISEKDIRIDGVDCILHSKLMEG